MRSPRRPASKTPLEHKAADDAGESMVRSRARRQHPGEKQDTIRLWEEHLKDPIVALVKALKCVENSC